MHSDESSIKQNLRAAISNLWRGWALSIGSVVAVNVLTLYISKLWLPLAALCFAMVLYTVMRINTESRSAHCSRIIYIGIVTLVCSAVIMTMINFVVGRTSLFANVPPELMPINPTIPYIAVLVLAPVLTLVSGWVLFKGTSHHSCVNCRIMHGEPCERGFIGRLFDQESNYQISMTFWFALCVSIGETIYYLTSYINVNINTADAFFFVWIPTIIFGVSLALTSIRYVTLWAYYNRSIEGSPLRNGRTTNVRFLIFCGDDIFVSDPATETTNDEQIPSEETIDTPAKVTVGYRQRISDYDAELFFRGITDVKPTMLRYLYHNNGTETGCSTFHFACVVDSKEVMDKARCKGQWLTLSTVQRLSSEGKVAPMLASEIVRIYRVTMAWKSYDRRGFRLYDVKNYHPTFRLRDFATWDVDYNDPTWLFVHANNEDQSFFRFRRLWRKYITGTSE